MHGIGSQQVGWRGAITQPAAMMELVDEEVEPPAREGDRSATTLHVKKYIWYYNMHRKKAATRPIARIHLASRQDGIK